MVGAGQPGQGLSNPGTSASAGGDFAASVVAAARRSPWGGVGTESADGEVTGLTAREVHVGQGPQACMIDVVTQGEAR